MTRHRAAQCAAIFLVCRSRSYGGVVQIVVTRVAQME